MIEEIAEDTLEDTLFEEVGALEEDTISEEVCVWEDAGEPDELDG